MTATLARPAPSRLPQRTRRLIVLGAAAISLTALVTVAVLPPGSMAIAATVLGAVCGFGYAMSRSAVWFVGNAPDTALDERERAIRDRAYVKAYGIFAGLAIVTAFYLLDLGPDLGLWVPTRYDVWWAIVWAFVMLGLGLPAAFVAWDMPDPVPDFEP